MTAASKCIRFYKDGYVGFTNVIHAHGVACSIRTTVVSGYMHLKVSSK